MPISYTYHKITVSVEDCLLILGDGLWKDLEAEFTRVHIIRKEVASVNAHRSDPDQLRKFRDLFLE